MRLYKLSLVIVLAASLIACGSVMKLVGKFSAAAMSVKVADVSDLTAFVKLASYNRPRPLLAMEKEWVKDRGMSDTEVKSHAFLMLTKGMKFAEVDGVVKVNDQPMDFMGNGVYTRTGEMTSGSKQTFFLKGKDGAPVEFTETYSGERMEIQSPASGDVLDLSQGFDVTWSPGMDAGKVVRVSLIVEQMGLENLIPLGFFPDAGTAHVSKQLIAEAHPTAQKIKQGKNTLLVERQRDEIRYIMAGDTIVGIVDADAVEVTVTGEPAAAMNPVIDGTTASKDGVAVTLAPLASLKTMTKLPDVRRFGLSSFVMKGRTDYTDIKSKTDTTYGADYKKTTTTTITTWEADLGKDNLLKIVDATADDFTGAVAGALSATEVPADAIKATKGYVAMSEVESESDPHAFFVTARGLTSLDFFRQLDVKIGGGLSWYYDMQKATSSQLLLEVYLTLTRKKPKGEKEFTFDVQAEVVARSYPLDVVEPHTFPVAKATWTSDSFEWEEGMDLAKVTGALKLDAFVAAYADAIAQYKTKQAALSL